MEEQITLGTVLQSLQSLHGKVDNIENRLDVMQNDIKFLKTESKFLRKTANLIIGSFEKADQRMVNRIEVVERSL